MKPALRYALPFAALLGLPLPAAAVDCAALLAGLHVTPIEAITEDDEDYCVENHLAALTLNIAAAVQADPVDDTASLVGTWLGDDVAVPLTGAMTAGQEVLRISEGPQAGTVLVQQFWYKANLPGRSGIPFDEQGAYVGLVAQAVLTVRTGGYFMPDTFDNPVHYAGDRVQFRRSNELYVLARLNHFDSTGQFLRNGDTLVLESERFPIPPQTDMWTNTSTYTRVSDPAPDIALMLVLRQSLSQVRFFDCFTHQISDGRGPLIAALAPFSTDELHAGLLRFAALTQRLERLQNPDIPLPEGQTRAEAFAQFQTDFVALLQTPIAQHLERMADTPDALGCASLR